MLRYAKFKTGDVQHVVTSRGLFCRSHGSSGPIVYDEPIDGVPFCKTCSRLVAVTPDETREFWAFSPGEDRYVSPNIDIDLDSGLVR